MAQTDRKQKGGGMIILIAILIFVVCLIGCTIIFMLSDILRRVAKINRIIDCGAN